MGKKKPHEHSQKALEVSVSEAGLKILAPILIAAALSLWGIKVSVDQFLQPTLQPDQPNTQVRQNHHVQ